MKKQYKTEGINRYLILWPEDLPSAGMACNMLLNNQIDGLLPFSVREADGNRAYYYQIEGKQPIHHVWKQDKVELTDVLSIFQQIMHCFYCLNRYLLPMGGLFLEAEDIYYREVDKSVSLCYVPGLENDVALSVKNLAELFMDHINHKDELAVVFIYGLYRLAGEENCSILVVQEYLESFIQRGHMEGRNEIPCCDWEPCSNEIDGLYYQSIGGSSQMGNIEYNRGIGSPDTDKTRDFLSNTGDQREENNPGSEEMFHNNSNNLDLNARYPARENSLGMDAGYPDKRNHPERNTGYSSRGNNLGMDAGYSDKRNHPERNTSCSSGGIDLGMDARYPDKRNHPERNTRYSSSGNNLGMDMRESTHGNSQNTEARLAKEETSRKSRHQQSYSKNNKMAWIPKRSPSEPSVEECTPEHSKNIKDSNESQDKKLGGLFCRNRKSEAAQQASRKKLKYLQGDLQEVAQNCKGNNISRKLKKPPKSPHTLKPYMDQKKDKTLQIYRIKIILASLALVPLAILAVYFGICHSLNNLAGTLLMAAADLWLLAGYCKKKAEKQVDEDMHQTTLLTPESDKRQEMVFQAAEIPYLKPAADLGQACINIDKTPLVIGSLQEAVDACIRDASISRLHAAVEKRNDEYYITDLESTNGTYLNGHRITPQIPMCLQQGDHVSFGKKEYEFCVHSVSAVV